MRSTKTFLIFLFFLSLNYPLGYPSAFGKTKQEKAQPTPEISEQPSKETPDSLPKPKKRERKPSATSKEVVHKTLRSDWNIGAGVTAGNNYLFYQTTFERRISPEITIGIMPLLSMASTTDSQITAVGGFITATYYFTRKEILTGLFGRMGLGAYSIKLKDSESDETLSNWGGMILGGYRGDLGKKITASAGLGFQYLGTPTTKSNKLTYEGFLPLVTAELGYRF